MNKFFSFILMALGMDSCCANEGFESVDADKFAKVISDTSVVVLDVRTATEYAEGYIGNATNIDVLKEDFEEKIQELDKTRTIAVYCRTGRRSKTAARLLVRHGYKVVELSPGYVGWIKRFPISTQK